MTLRGRLTAYYTASFSIALVLLGTGLYLVMRQLLIGNVDDELRVGSTLVLQAYATDNRLLRDPAGFDFMLLYPPTVSDVESPELYVQVADANGTILARSSNIQNGELPLPAAEVEAALQGQDVERIERIGTARVQMLIVPLQSDSQVVGVVQVAQSLRVIDRSLTILLWALVAGGIVTVLAAARGSLWLTRAAMEPIDHISATASRILGAEDLHARVAHPTTNDEVARLVHTINDMLARMEHMFGAQRRFTADMAHELRTPLAAMRGNLEILRRGAIDDPVMLKESLHDIESEVARLTRMANDLLVLAQADAGVSLRWGTVQLDEVLLEVYRDLRPLADGITIKVDLQEPIAILGDRDRLKQALINLVANALQHTPKGGTVTLGLHRDRDHALLSVADTGHGIPAEQQTLLFERFFRGDGARSEGGAGLGLSIVRWIAEAHSGEVAVTSEPEAGATFTLRLPLAQSAKPSAAS